MVVFWGWDSLLTTATSENSVPENCKVTHGARWGGSCTATPGKTPPVQGVAVQLPPQREDFAVLLEFRPKCLTPLWKTWLNEEVYIVLPQSGQRPYPS